MPRGQSLVVVKNIQTLFRAGTAGGLTDGQLLERFLSGAMARATPHSRRLWKGTRPWSCASAAMLSMTGTTPRMPARPRLSCSLARRAQSKSSTRSQAGSSESLAAWPPRPAPRPPGDADTNNEAPSLKEPGSSTTTTSASLGSSSTKKSIACPSAARLLCSAT